MVKLSDICHFAWLSFVLYTKYNQGVIFFNIFLTLHLPQALHLLLPR